MEIGGSKSYGCIDLNWGGQIEIFFHLKKRSEVLHSPGDWLWGGAAHLWLFFWGAHFCLKGVLIMGISIAFLRSKSPG